MTVTIRHATIDDSALILRFIHALATHSIEQSNEHSSEPMQVKTTEQDIRGQLFGRHPHAEVLIAEQADEPIGFALFYPTWSTWTGCPGIHLEDLFIDPDARGSGAGRALMHELARIAIARNCARLEWDVHRQNAPAINFYRSLGATAMSDWTRWRLAGPELTMLGAPHE